MKNCIFCKIVHGESPSHKIWEDEKHIAFLSIFPNTSGFSVVATKTHHPSDVFSLPDEVVTNLVLAAKKVAKLLEEKLEDVGRTGLILEGFGVDHLHAKLFPMHGTKTDEWKQRRSRAEERKYFQHYEGYIASNDYEREDDEKLKELARKIRE